VSKTIKYTDMNHKLRKLREYKSLQTGGLFWGSISMYLP